MSFLGKGTWQGASVMDVYQTQPEKEQAIFRTSLGSIALLIYLGFTAPHLDQATRTTIGMMALYVVFGAVTWLAISIRPGTSPTRLTVTTIVDQGMAITALALGGRAALPLLFIVFWFLVGTGCRYGKRPLFISCVIAVGGVLGLMAWEPWWASNRPVGDGLLFSVIATSFYLFVLVNKLERRAATDPLTGLLNRSSLEHAVAHAQSIDKTRDNLSALFVIDLNGFKEVNDTLGHAAGDELLQSFARELTTIRRGDDTVARLGGDEFVFFARTIQGRTGAIAIADGIHEAIAKVSVAAGTPVYLSASIGVHLWSARLRAAVQDLRYFVQKADRAMYVAKSRGLRQTVFADEI